MSWVAPVAIIGGAVTITGWFVTALLSLYETKRGNRHAVYTKLLGPTSECIASLRRAEGGGATDWNSRHMDRFDGCYARLVAAEGEVDLLGRGTVSGSARQLTRTLRRAYDLGSDEASANFETELTKLLEDSRTARLHFLFAAGRSLEWFPMRKCRDWYGSDRREEVRRLRRLADVGKTSPLRQLPDVDD